MLACRKLALAATLIFSAATPAYAKDWTICGNPPPKWALRIRAEICKPGPGKCHLERGRLADANDPIWTNRALCNRKTKRVHFCFVPDDDNPPDLLCGETARVAKPAASSGGVSSAGLGVSFPKDLQKLTPGLTQGSMKGLGLSPQPGQSQQGSDTGAGTPVDVTGACEEEKTDAY